MPSGKRTSAEFYYRGIPKEYKDFAAVAAGNYSIFQPARPQINSIFFKKSISNIITLSR